MGDVLNVINTSVCLVNGIAFVVFASVAFIISLRNFITVHDVGMFEVKVNRENENARKKQKRGEIFLFLSS